jgi:hypothetical protein
MPDWRQVVRERLAPLTLPGPREQEIGEELALQLEQSYDDARAAGAGETEATARALAQMGDWRLLAAEITAAERPVDSPPPPAFDHLRRAISALADKDLDREIDFFRQKGTVREALVEAAVHPHEHLGQAIAYARAPAARCRAAGRRDEERSRDRRRRAAR